MAAAYSHKDFNKSNIAILVFPFAAPNVFDFSQKTVAVLSSVADDTLFISGGIPCHIKWPDKVEIHDIGIRLHYLNTKHPSWYSAILWIAKAFTAQLLMGLKVIELSRRINIIYCAMGVYYQFPILVAKTLGKRVISASMGDYSLKAQMNYGKFIARLTSLLSYFNFYLSDGVIVESFRLANFKDLLPCQSKLLHGALFLENPESYKSKTPIDERGDVIGFIGRLVTEKGIIEFLHAIPLILEKQPDVHFLIIGAGILDREVDKNIRDKPWSKQVTKLGWVEHDKIPDYISALKLLVVPSYDEGLPNLVLEAFGCDTPVLASNAGGIPDLITNNVTGFTLEIITPEEIADAVLAAINCPNLFAMTKNARDLLKRKYSFSAACRRYKAILEKIA